MSILSVDNRVGCGQLVGAAGAAAPTGAFTA